MLKIVLFLFVYVIFGVYTDINFLKKFHQSDYKAKFTRLEIISYDKEVLNSATATTFKYNRSTTAFNVSWNAKIDFGRKMEFVIKAKQFLSNEYRRIMISFQLNFCQIMEHNIVGLANVAKCGNLTNCNLSKELTYNVCNFVPDASHLPPFLLNGQFLIDIYAVYLEREIAVINCYLEIYRTIPIPKT